MASLGHSIGLFVFLLAAPLANSNSVQAELLMSEYRGTCDASAAVSIGNNHFIVANDEDNNLRVYRLGYPDPVKSFNLDSFAKVDPENPELDIEAAARIGDRIYWITSHGANKNAKFRPGRRRLLATEFSFKNGKPKVTTIGFTYAGLLDDISVSAQLKKYRLDAAAQIAPKDEGGLNIEGLAETPGGALLIGFRNPILSGNALLVTINNPGDVIQGKRPVIGPVLELPLGGLGIRSIERDGDSYIIIAGPYDNNGKFRLFRWQGPSGRGKLIPILTVDFKELHPEALFISSQGHVHILSDDGAREINGVNCKDSFLKENRFRTMNIKLENTR